MRRIFGFILILALGGCAANKSAVKNLPMDYCAMLSYQDSKLSGVEKRELNKYGIIFADNHKETYLYLNGERIPNILISDKWKTDCETRVRVAQYLDNALTFESPYYKKTKDDPAELPEAFAINPAFVVKNKKLISELVYQFLSPKHYYYTHRVDSGGVEQKLLWDEHINDVLSIVEDRLNAEGLLKQFEP